MSRASPCLESVKIKLDLGRAVVAGALVAIQPRHGRWIWILVPCEIPHWVHTGSNGRRDNGRANPPCQQEVPIDVVEEEVPFDVACATGEVPQSMREVCIQEAANKVAAEHVYVFGKVQVALEDLFVGRKGPS